MKEIKIEPATEIENALLLLWDKWIRPDNDKRPVTMLFNDCRIIMFQEKSK